jgi:hypothetical protein
VTARALPRLAVLVALIVVGAGLAWHLRGPPSRGSDLAPSGSAVLPADVGKPPLRVLFVGNSYTFVNDLPGVVRHLASAAREPLRLEAVQECPGGATLKQHWDSGRDVALLHETHFDWMVLQGQSEEPSFEPAQLERDMYPYVAKLVDAGRETGTRALLFLTWARREGDPANAPGDTYAAMQRRIVTGYETVSARLRVPVAPVGIAWQRALESPPGTSLWASDGSHPSVAGTYLAACVIYAALFGHSPAGNRFTEGLDERTASTLQGVAADTVAAYVQP